MSIREKRTNVHDDGGDEITPLTTGDLVECQTGNLREFRQQPFFKRTFQSLYHVIISAQILAVTLYRCCYSMCENFRGVNTFFITDVFLLFFYAVHWMLR